MVGDLVNRGPDSLGTLKRLRGLGDAATCLLGNHDLNLLAVAHGLRKERKDDTIDDILASKKRDEWLDWLRQRRMAHMFNGWLLVHAGVVPQWDTATTLALAGEIETLLRGPDLPELLQGMYGSEPAQWSDALQGAERWRFIVNTLDAHPLLHARRPAGVEGQGRRRRGAAGLPALVRCGRAAHARHAHRLRPLVHAGLDQPPRPAGAGHRAACGAAR